jgi:hypothetical protein
MQSQLAAIAGAQTSNLIHLDLLSTVVATNVHTFFVCL